MKISSEIRRRRSKSKQGKKNETKSLQPRNPFHIVNITKYDVLPRAKQYKITQIFNDINGYKLLAMETKLLCEPGS